MKQLKLSFLFLLMAFCLTANADVAYPDDIDDDDDDIEVLADSAVTADPDAKYAVDANTQDGTEDLDLGTTTSAEDDSKYAKYKTDGTLYFLGDDDIHRTALSMSW